MVFTVVATAVAFLISSVGLGPVQGRVVVVGCSGGFRGRRRRGARLRRCRRRASPSLASSLLVEGRRRRRARVFAGLKASTTCATASLTFAAASSITEGGRGSSIRSSIDSMISASLFSAIGSDGEGAAAGAGASSSLSDDESLNNSARRPSPR